MNCKAWYVFICVQTVMVNIKTGQSINEMVNSKGKIKIWSTRSVYNYDFAIDSQGFLKKEDNGEYLVISDVCDEFLVYKAEKDLDKNDKKFYIDGPHIVTTTKIALQATEKDSSYFFAAPFDPTNALQSWMVENYLKPNCSPEQKEEEVYFNLVSMSNPSLKLYPSWEINGENIVVLGRTYGTGHFFSRRQDGGLHTDGKKVLVFDGYDKPAKMKTELSKSDQEFFLSVDDKYIRTATGIFLELVQKSKDKWEAVAKKFKEAGNDQMWQINYERD